MVVLGRKWNKKQLLLQLKISNENMVILRAMEFEEEQQTCGLKSVLSALGSTVCRTLNAFQNIMNWTRLANIKFPDPTSLKQSHNSSSEQSLARPHSWLLCFFRKIQKVTAPCLHSYITRNVLGASWLAIDKVIGTQNKVLKSSSIFWFSCTVKLISHGPILSAY